VAKTLERDLGDDGDGRRMQEVDDLRTGDRAADQDPPLASTMKRAAPGAFGA
jgi:hypothetical protein